MAIATDGSAVLGLGALGPLAALPVMEGKALLFKHFGGLNAYPICLDVATPEALVDAVAAVAPGFGGINFEDIAAPACFWVEAELQSRLDIPVFHDDQHGTAAVVLAAVLNGCRMTGRELSGVRAVLVGVGAAGTAVAEGLLDAGVGELVAFDVDGVLSSGPGAAPHHARLAARCNQRGLKTLRAALAGADLFIGTSRRGAVEPSMLAAHGPSAPDVRPGQPGARGVRRGARRGGGGGHRPERFPQPDKQLALFPRLFQGRAVRPGRVRDTGHESGSHPGHRRVRQ